MHACSQHPNLKTLSLSVLLPTIEFGCGGVGGGGVVGSVALGSVCCECKIALKDDSAAPVQCSQQSSNTVWPVMLKRLKIYIFNFGSRKVTLVGTIAMATCACHCRSLSLC
jgi:hypothetical protein